MPVQFYPHLACHFAPNDSKRNAPKRACTSEQFPLPLLFCLHHTCGVHYCNFPGWTCSHDASLCDAVAGQVLQSVSEHPQPSGSDTVADFVQKDLQFGMLKLHV